MSEYRKAFEYLMMAVRWSKDEDDDFIDRLIELEDAEDSLNNIKHEYDEVLERAEEEHQELIEIRKFLTEQGITMSVHKKEDMPF